MSANENAGNLARRRFLKLSGAAGAAAVLVGSAAAAGTNLPAAAAQTDPCGAYGDTGIKLWDHAKACGEAQRDPTHHPMPSYCKGTNAYDVVLDGADPPGTHNFLLVPTSRLKGIECSKIRFGRNFWQDAWDQAQPGGVAPVTYSGGQIGLGVNAAQDTAGKPVRDQDQLHIHMAGISTKVLDQLNKAGIKNDVNGWAASRVKLEFNGDTRYYRALQVTNLNQNLFALMFDNVARPTREDIAIQMMIVTQSPHGFYVLTSNSGLTGAEHGIGGTSSCDRLLVYT
ncbi:CDP-diacylglycerol diphosphatase [Saccharopolyspora sp. ASAGF58]|uniref:CDP-diacylglycerol diphosphatase n=1 Tax=Saccharopolyspora sp. ASAGF58 TaxID=2719023 RepID=UPI00143FE5C8|nr:CDP-diacylglycerol diphosphatase [Saccharopolyspora sp. ASAGF58]QIZ37515.1 CDP-diacylglycerol diphosphatase [Saccharopolyspora sp. ASAGF58]